MKESRRKIILSLFCFGLCLFFISFLALKENRQGGHDAGKPIVQKRQTLFYKEIATSPYAEKDKPAHPTGKQYTVEVKVVYSQQEADKILKELHDMAVSAYFTPFHKSGEVYYRVRLGVLDSETEASQLAGTLPKQYREGAKVTPL